MINNNHNWGIQFESPSLIDHTRKKIGMTPVWLFCLYQPQEILWGNRCYSEVPSQAEI